MDRSIYRRKCLERLIAAHSLNFKRKLNMIYLVESSCSTHRAAELLQISVSTLYRARTAGKEYKYGKWIARSIGANSWNVSLQHTA